MGDAGLNKETLFTLLVSAYAAGLGAVFLILTNQIEATNNAFDLHAQRISAMERKDAIDDEVRRRLVNMGVYLGDDGNPISLTEPWAKRCVD